MKNLSHFDETSQSFRPSQVGRYARLYCSNSSLRAELTVVIVQRYDYLLSIQMHTVIVHDIITLLCYYRFVVSFCSGFCL